jgi:hypothetical protein
MDTTDYFAAYFSHSWSDRDVAINLMLWKQLAERCRLLIDKPQPTTDEARPYFISRIESLVRRSDVFVACLPALPPEKRQPRPPGATGDWRYNLCSPYILFELRLAERADLPRFVLYDLESRFQPPAHAAPHVCYVGRRFDELRTLIAAGGLDHRLVEEADAWLARVAESRRPEPEQSHGRAAYLLADDEPGAKFRGVIADAIEHAGFDEPRPLDALFHTDAELCQGLRSLDLLVVDVARPELLPLYFTAHALLVPTIRVHSGESPPGEQGDAALPALLRGHPAGYQKDLIGPAQDEVVFRRIHDRATASTRGTEPIIGFDRGQSLLYERTYPGPHFVFLSHDQKLHDRALIEEIVAGCRAVGITIWEYAVENRSGEVWRQKMDEALAKSTHMVALLSPGYEQSEGCREEWEFALAHGLPLLPFFTNGRTTTAFQLRSEKIAHEPLTRTPQENARRVVERLRECLLRPAAK